MNDLPEEISDDAWQLYEDGVCDAIRDDLKRYDLRDYLPPEMLDRLECQIEARTSLALAEA